MIYLTSWFILAVCSYCLWFRRSDVLFEEYGGFVEAFKIYVFRDNPDDLAEIEYLVSPVLKTILLVASFITWPAMLFCVVKSYFYFANEKSKIDEMMKGEDE